LVILAYSNLVDNHSFSRKDSR